VLTLVSVIIFGMNPGEDFTGIIVSFFCHDGQGNFLLHKRSNKCRDEHGTWDNGGGRLRFGENPRDGVLREVKEEYSCEGAIEHELHPVNVIREWNGVKTHWISHPFIIRVSRADVQIGDKGAIDEIGWFRINEFPEPQHNGSKIVREHHKKIFNKFI